MKAALDAHRWEKKKAKSYKDGNNDESANDIMTSSKYAGGRTGEDKKNRTLHFCRKPHGTAFPRDTVYLRETVYPREILIPEICQK